ncbi:glutathione S-transferase family protein [Janthinobacterium agaricidamnosum]|uniref:Glutathione S-transferase, N-terminal domain protein n=1 Tax=Janthinobacterium agaricidamnosum NBRC 102515 = DSM 9628 TaxID=1349767 RepID=W0VE69_9BURK|nr:glutathione S-transferase family protein [Janthinobacterium agaricidamnosum]CDG85627.1 glutathione S-transferase, N-terminal domain protein [Janthinobacterium agaricidamnosum NBRC 102515 = DSM 9628]
MHTIELDPTLTQALAAARQPGLTLIIGNKNYSSWSMRPWVALAAFGIPFQEVRLLLDQPDTASKIAEYSACGRVPVLLAGEMTIWDSLAICEYLAEQFPDKHMWPQDVAARATARSICAEMHSGFAGLRNAMSMNLRVSLPGRGRNAASQADIGRISEIWEECLSRFGHHQFLFGDFSIADAYFAPVVMRFHTYGVSLAPALNAYCERVRAHPAVARWIEEALAETEVAARHDAELPD